MADSGRDLAGGAGALTVGLLGPLEVSVGGRPVAVTASRAAHPAGGAGGLGRRASPYAESSATSWRRAGLNNLGLLYEEQGRYDQALACSSRP
jgi:hypothetical protein